MKIEDVCLNPMKMFGKDWCLIAAGNQKDGYNAMTIGWGQIGCVWDRRTEKGKEMIPVVTVYIRPQRYTKNFFDQEDFFTVTTFDEQYRKALGYMGSHSGQDEDKNAGLTPFFLNGTVSFKEAKEIYVCR